jgi:hypothetical protein
MATQRKRPSRFATGSKQAPPAVRFSPWLFPIQGEIENLESSLDAFNERIVELENEGHRGHAVDVLKAKAIDLARKIDELRSLLVEPAKKGQRPV